MKNLKIVGYEAHLDDFRDVEEEEEETFEPSLCLGEILEMWVF